MRRDAFPLQHLTANDGGRLLHYEDFPLGEVAMLGPRVVTREEIIAFAREFDMQAFPP